MSPTMSFIVCWLLWFGWYTCTAFSPSPAPVHFHTIARSGKSYLQLQSDEQHEFEEELDEIDDFGVSDQVEYGKFIVEDDREAIDPLPPFLTEDNEVVSAPSNDDTRIRIEQQQQQIDMLMQLVRNQGVGSQTPESSSPIPPSQIYPTDVPSTPVQGMMESSSSANLMSPLKAMMFIDGTWLYYSINGRPNQFCPIIQKYGHAWQRRYDFKWSELPRIVCEQLQHQAGWTNSPHDRPVEVARASVFTSVMPDTHPKSQRMQIFQKMKEANYDVFMMTTAGRAEKCIDIQLAVEMLHYATVPNAYDVAILLSGDKDFLPALLRTRQKARKVAIVSMRSACNAALYKSPNVKDYDVIWIEDYLDRLLVPKEGVDVNDQPSLIVSQFTLIKVVMDFVQASGFKQVSSRDLGIYLKQLKIGKTSMLSEIKVGSNSLAQFLRTSTCFDLIPTVDKQSGAAFWVGVGPTCEEKLLQEAKSTRFSPEEKDFFDSYSLAALEDRSTAFMRTLSMLGAGTDAEWEAASEANGSQGRPDPPQTEPSMTVVDYSILKVTELKQICRERSLQVTGRKAELIKRIEAADLQQQEEKQQQQEATQQPEDPQSAFLAGLITEFIHASGGTASSRDAGRYLNSNRSFHANEGRRVSALADLKSQYGSLAGFIRQHPQIFTRSDTGGAEFHISLTGVETR